MNKRKISLITLAATLALSSSALVATTLPAYADRDVTVTSTNIFYASADASVDAKKVNDDHYVLLNVESESAAVSYRKDLAYSWVENDNGAAKQGSFNMEMGVEGNYKKFIVKFQSQQYVETEDGVSNNYIVFESNSSDGATVYVTTDLEGDLGEGKTMTAEQLKKFTVAFNGRTDDGSGYKVLVGGNEFTFENIGGSYADYVSASKSNPATPLSFSAEFAEDLADTKAGAIIYSLNGQAFNYKTSTNANGYDKKIVDNAAPVLCFDDEVRFLLTGGEVNVKPVAIDVVASSPTITTHFYIYEEGKAPEYTEVKTDDEYFLLDTESTYYPTAAEAEAVFGKDFKASGLVKVYYTAKDVSTTSGVASGEIYLDWYVDDQYKVNKESNSYLFIGKDQQGVSYDTNAFQAYQDEIDALTIENGQPKLNAGSSNYLYLPAVEKLFKDNVNDYTDLKFSIYYKTDSQKSRTALNYNKLSINIATDGIYVFTVYATDASGNDMYYIDENGEVVKVSASEIWNYYNEDEKRELGVVPWFTFKVGYTKATVEAPGSQPTGYIGTKYTAESFDINGVSGKYTATYSLLLFDRIAYTEYLEGKGDNDGITYKEFVESVGEIFENADTRKYFNIIPAIADMNESDAEYETYSAYEWNKTSLSFIPQDEGRNSFYVIKLTLSDKDSDADAHNEYMAISVSKKATALPGESEWLKNNVASVVLLGIAGLSLVGIVVVLVIKPKQENDLDLATPENE